MADDAAKIIEICEREWPDAKDDCNKFVKAVAGALGGDPGRSSGRSGSPHPR
jgi:hypothetical protein